ncbi:MAG: LysR family transcriptional regulator [Alphaproteobacteria bacterium]|nr:LysR family transcriptional regulator [Alphaproteobacteria bacterium]
MSIKQKLSLIKAALYFNEVLREKKISAAAQKNGIKQTNLSKLISEFEQAVNIPLLRRDNTGITPTNYGLKISETIKELEQKITELEKYILHFPNKTISYYFSPGITLNSLDLFQQEHPGWKLFPCPRPQDAQLSILTSQPDWNCEYTCLHTQGNISQKLWITCQMDNPEAVLFYEFITRQLLS